VWSGTDAITQGLVDLNGGLNKSIEVAAHMAGLDDYTIEELPTQLQPIQQLLSDLINDYETRIIKHQMGEYYDQWKLFQSLKDQSGILAKMPYDLKID
ncbi:MAG: signal peptide peptidase SppA, partial [Bacteroidetes bacterium]|nr:signal peptide peptidase SppA [Bacteroidota bacterium]